jgi:Flp pilus assembly protein TadG
MRGTCGGRRAIATVEFALVAPLLMLLLAGVLDFSMLLRTATCASSAARAGTEYGSRTPSASTDYAGMEAAALDSTPGVAGMTAAAGRFCECAGGAAVSCSGSCPGGKMLVYVKVTTQVTAPNVFHYSGLPISNLLTSAATMRAQ